MIFDRCHVDLQIMFTNVVRGILEKPGPALKEGKRTWQLNP
jgi:hypothetical protein